MTIRLTPEIANEIALKAMMCSRAYVKDPKRTHFPVETLGWERVGLPGREPPGETQNSYSPRTCIGKIFSNLQFDIWEKEHSDETIIAFKGTDEKIDWIVGNVVVGLAVPYKSAKKKVQEYCDCNPTRKVALTGHSLGGGLALSVSLWRGHEALVFNSSPRVFDGWRNNKQPAVRRAVFQYGDILQWVRAKWFKFRTTIPDEDIVETHFKYGGESNHRMDLLAEGIVRAASDPIYVNIANNIPPKFTVPPM